MSCKHENITGTYVSLSSPGCLFCETERLTAALTEATARAERAERDRDEALRRALGHRYAAGMSEAGEDLLRQENERLERELLAALKRCPTCEELTAVNADVCARAESAERERDAARAEVEDMQRKLSEAFDDEVRSGHAALQKERALKERLRAAEAVCEVAAKGDWMTEDELETALDRWRALTGPASAEDK